MTDPLAFNRHILDLVRSSTPDRLARGTVTVVEGSSARVRSGAGDVPGFLVPPGMIVEVGDVVFAYDEGGFRLVLLNLTRDAFATDAIGEELWLPANRGFLVAGSPALGLASNHQGWLLDAAATETVGWVERIPRHWKELPVQLSVWWVNAGAGSGNVRWSVAGRNDTVGAALSTTDATLLATATAGAQSVLMRTEMGLIGLLPDRPVLVSVSRIGADAADTLANDVLLLGLRLRRS